MRNQAGGINSVLSLLGRGTRPCRQPPQHKTGAIVLPREYLNVAAVQV